jgi:DNA-binding HxlR family transcriptional regulator
MKGRKTDLATMDCGIARALAVIGDWWSLLILRDAFRGHRRFGEFQKSLGLAKNILSSRLKKLVEEGVLDAVPEDGSPSRKLYVPTKKGETLGIVLVSLWQWGEEHCFADGELTRMMVDRAQSKPLARLSLQTEDGRTIGPRDFTTVPKSRGGAGKSRPV